MSWRPTRLGWTPRRQQSRPPCRPVAPSPPSPTRPSQSSIEARHARQTSSLPTSHSLFPPSLHPPPSRPSVAARPASHAPPTGRAAGRWQEAARRPVLSLRGWRPAAHTRVSLASELAGSTARSTAWQSTLQARARPAAYRPRLIAAYRGLSPAAYRGLSPRSNPGPAAACSLRAALRGIHIRRRLAALRGPQAAGRARIAPAPPAGCGLGETASYV